MIHELKIKECYWKDVWNGRKTFEIRKNDRDFHVGDVIHFHRIDDEGIELPISKDFDEKYNRYVITYVFNGGEYGLDKDYCIFGIRQVIKFKADEELSRVRDLTTLLQHQPQDNLLIAEVDEDEDVAYNIMDVLKGGGTSAGFTYISIRSDEEG